MATKRAREGQGATWGGTFDVNDYPRGSIKHIKVNDFMTYKEAVIYPGPRLNLVLGPNGSGKSSIVCAVGLALCCPPKLLGRACDIKEYVRKGQKQATVELLISGGPERRDYRIERVVHAEANTSTFKIDGASRPLKEVEKLNRDLNIQLDNLCQFLPQEKVVEFSKMTPTELLRSTERAIGNAALHHMHEQLLEGGKSLKEQLDTQANTKRQLEKKVLERDAMQRDVDKIAQHDKLKLEADMLRARALQLLHDAAAEDLAAKTEEHAANEEKLGQLDAAVEKAKRPQLKMRKQVEELKLKERRAQQDQRGLHEELVKYSDSLDDADASCKAALDSIDECVKKEAHRCRELSDHRALLNKLLDEQERMPDQPAGIDAAQEQAWKAERSSLNDQLADISNARSQLDHEASMVRPAREQAIKQLERLEQVAYRRMNVLEQKLRFRGLGQFAQHVEQMKREGHFKGNVYGPLATEINMHQDAPPYAAKALENAISRRMMSVFAVEHREDQDLLTQVARQMKVSNVVNVIAYGGNVNEPVRHPLRTHHEYAGLGVVATLDTVFDCPALVKHVLCDEHNLNTMFLVARDGDADRVFQNSNIRLLFSPENRHAKMVSRYSKSGVSFTTNQTQPPLLLSVAVDEAGITQQRRIIADCDLHIQTFQQRADELTEQERAATQQRNELDSRLRQNEGIRKDHRLTLSKLKHKIEKLKRDIDRLEKEFPLLAKPALKKKLQSIKRAEMSKMQAITDQLLPKQLATMKESAVLTARRSKLEDDITALELMYQESMQGLNEMKQLVRVSEQALREANAKAQERKRSWAEARQKLPDDSVAALAGLPESVEECEARTDDLETQADRIAVGDRGLVQRYHKLRKDIDAQTAQATQQDAHIASLQGKLDEAKARWLPELKAKIASISGAFSENFARIGSVGEVGLFEAGEDYASYAIQIKVKFRDEGDLEVLSASQHSGGEKSVSTIMFLLSLQKITATPFRVVDEINQGMDQTNERKVFQAMVDAATERNTAQCLLMTPKLLPQLEYSEHVNVLSICNGVHMAEVQKRLVPNDQLKLLLGEHAKG